MKKIILLFSLSLFIFSCNNAPKDEGPSKMDEVIGVHDEIMPKLGTIARLVGDLNDYMKENGSNEAMEKAVLDLQTAHKGMMSWMKTFGGEFTADEILRGAELSKEKKELLLVEEQNILQLKHDFLSSIENAERLLPKE